MMSLDFSYRHKINFKNLKVFHLSYIRKKNEATFFKKEINEYSETKLTYKIEVVLMGRKEKKIL